MNKQQQKFLVGVGLIIAGIIGLFVFKNPMSGILLGAGLGLIA